MTAPEGNPWPEIPDRSALQEEDDPRTFGLGSEFFELNPDPNAVAAFRRLMGDPVIATSRAFPAEPPQPTVDRLTAYREQRDAEIAAENNFWDAQASQPGRLRRPRPRTSAELSEAAQGFGEALLSCLAKAATPAASGPETAVSPVRPEGSAVQPAPPATKPPRTDPEATQLF